MTQSYSIENDYLNEFCDPVNYDLEEEVSVGNNPPAHAFYVALASAVNGPVLEIASGTGLATLKVAKAGIDITGLEIVPEMLAHAQHKAAQMGLSVRWVQGDARTFSLDQRFKLIYMTGNAFQAFLNNTDQRALLQRVHAHLAPDGLFAFETRNPNWHDLTTDLTETEWLHYTSVAGYDVTISEVREYDPVAQVLVYTLWRRWQAIDGPKERTTRIALRYTFPQELRGLLESSGFTIRHQYGGWDKRPLDAQSTTIISICRLTDLTS
ncbi:MAG: class I SAM-dependent methyltransferase [Caldilineaceae bacterium]